MSEIEGTLQYDVFFNEDGSECIVHERYRDSEALQATRQTSVTLPHDATIAPHRVRFPSIGARRGDEESFIPAAQVGESFHVQP